ncbi:MAG: hypothetical protein LBC72_02215 [Spirochaetaceae bacterium]|jgi:hypothetical protein|nr:hypothetical protein [Spirochaetaceae bacterium]
MNSAAIHQRAYMPLLSSAGKIARARGFRLYTEDGRRLVDLWQDGGKALLGHNPAAVTRALKNTAGRGLFAALPSRADDRFARALKTLFPAACGFAFLDAAFFSQPAEWARALNVPLWRPFAADSGAVQTSPRFVPVLPWPLAPVVLVQTEGAADQPLLPPPPLILAAATRAIYSLLAAPERGGVRYSQVEAALGGEAGGFRRDGIYLYVREANGWADVFAAGLNAGFLLPPAPEHPLILPAGLGAGEEARLAALLAAAPV